MKASRTRKAVRYAGSIGLVIAATLVSELFGHEISPANLVMVYLLPVVIAAVYLGRWPAVLTSLAGVMAFDYFFVSPRFSFSVADTEYLLTLSGLLVVGWVISYMTIRAREQAESAQQREAETASLYSLSKDLAAAEGLDEVLRSIQTNVNQTFSASVVIFLAKKGEMNPTNALANDQELDEPEIEAARWAFRHAENAGRETNIMPSVAFRYLPLRTAHGTLGVLGVHSRINSGDNTGLLTELNPDQLRLLDAFASQSGQALERAQLAEQARQVKLLKEAEKLQNALLNSISHDLRTPLVSITGVLSLLERDEQMDEKTRRNLVITAREEADRLNRLVGNLLDMTRLESGALQLKREACDVQDLIGSVLGQMESRLEGRNISTEIQPDIPLVPLDFVLIAHVLTNLLDNALKYSPEGSPLCIKAEVTGVDVKISVIDQGIGIPEDALTRVFDKFYRVKPFQHEQVTGTGLGLAICKGFVEAHGGRIWAESRAGLITPQEPVRYPRPAPTGTVISIVIPTELPG